MNPIIFILLVILISPFVNPWVVGLFYSYWKTILEEKEVKRITGKGGYFNANKYKTF